ncbi:hypothetical protein BDV93DRAFT_560765 [Ceratobasidium sp. AG-I]|nr:hypothetical protein BDV93DRAFT_560764 [Ceratobasidium sp. AG-I]KAF8598989.1 hypothetical protein BDV93DRAFT_560765 [Ceratobasidium sp. AG-I]
MPAPTPPPRGDIDQTRLVRLARPARIERPTSRVPTLPPRGAIATMVYAVPAADSTRAPRPRRTIPSTNTHDAPPRRSTRKGKRYASSSFGSHASSASNDLPLEYSCRFLAEI